MKKQYFSGRSQSGAFLLQIAFALVIMGIIIKAYYEYQIAGNEKQLKQIIAGEMLDLDKALTNYANTFSGQLIANTAISGVSNIYAPTISELASLNVGLPSTFSANSMLNGGYKTAVSILSPNNDIQVVVYTANPVTNSSLLPIRNGLL